jgi:hypothetical protein
MARRLDYEEAARQPRVPGVPRGRPSDGTRYWNGTGAIANYNPGGGLFQNGRASRLLPKLSCRKYFSRAEPDRTNGYCEWCMEPYVACAREC